MKSKKSFLKWHKLKVRINEKRERVFFHEREIWFCSLGLNIGHEMDGKNENFERPVLIIKKFNNKTFLAVPLTKRTRNGKYYFNWKFIKGIKSSLILTQIRFLDSKRLQRKTNTLDKQVFSNAIRKIFKLVLN